MAVGTELTMPGKIGASIGSENPPLQAIPFITTDDSAFPHVALISYFQLIEDRGLHFVGLRSSSRSAGYLNLRPRATLIFLTTSGVYYLKASTEFLAEEGGWSVFALGNYAVQADFPNPQETGARLETVIDFSLTEEGSRYLKSVRDKIRQIVSRRRRGEDPS